MENQLISIIVPVYNVEDLLDKCIESIIVQDYQNLDIILVDDGSQDQSLQICQNYAKLDSRIRVFHKSNEGQSSARNFGIQHALGDYLFFLDSDDYIVSDCISHLYFTQKKYNSQICIGKNINPALYNGQIYYNGQAFEHNYPSKEAIKLAYYGFPDKFGPSVTAKLFDKNLFNDIRFKKGIIFEDWDVIIDLFDKSEFITFSNKFIYFYYVRPGSTINNKSNLCNGDFVSVTDTVASKMRVIDKDYFYQVSNYITMSSRVSFLLGAYLLEMKDDLIKKYKKYIRENLISIMKDRNVNLINKVKVFFLCFVNPKIFRFIYKAYKK